MSGERQKKEVKKRERVRERKVLLGRKALSLPTTHQTVLVERTLPEM